MTDLRKAAQQALEALLTPSGAQACSTCQNGPENEYCCRMEMWSAITALRAALAQQDEPTIDEYPLWSGMPPPEPRIHYEGPVTFHTQRCAVLPGQHAVLQMNTGVFHPSWAAQEHGWRLVCADTWLRKLALRLFGDA